jgi:hypothetical protein
MTTTYKRSGAQGTSSLGTYATLYTVPANTSAVISTISICNTASAAATYRIGFDDTEGTPGASEWLVYDSIVSANDTAFLSIGAALSSEEYIRVSSSSDTVTFQLFVSEIS